MCYKKFKRFWVAQIKEHPYLKEPEKDIYVYLHVNARSKTTHHSFVPRLTNVVLTP